MSDIKVGFLWGLGFAVAVAVWALAAHLMSRFRG